MYYLITFTNYNAALYRVLFIISGRNTCIFYKVKIPQKQCGPQVLVYPKWKWKILTFSTKNELGTN